MSNKAIDPLLLRRIDPAQNMRRFYTLNIQPTLFGEVSLIRNRGRIGTSPQLMIETCDQADEARHASSSLARAKRPR